MLIFYTTQALGVLPGKVYSHIGRWYAAGVDGMALRLLLCVAIFFLLLGTDYIILIFKFT